jgi:hypothetical protein
MLHLPDPIIAIFIHFQPLFTTPSYRKMLWLVTGTLLAHGNRTVTAALKMLGFSQEPTWSKYHHLLNRAKWSALQASAILVRLLVTTFVAPDAPLEVVMDETLERRWGQNIKKRGHWRDSLASSHGRNVTTSGLRWLVTGLLLKLPFSNRLWALPFLSVLLTTPKVSEKLNLPHRTPVDRAAQIIGWLRRTFPKRALKLIGDGAYGSIQLGLACKRHNTSLISLLRMDARLFSPPSPRNAKTRGRSRVVGERLPTPAALAKDLTQNWELCEVAWYGGARRQMYLLSGVALWYSTGFAPLQIRWVLVRDPKAKLKTMAYFSTEVSMSSQSIVADFVKRWNIEVTFEESRAHLGVETQRQFNDLAIERTTPILFGMYSLVCLFANALHPSGEIPLMETAWYSKTSATFSDLLAAVRKGFWGEFNFQTMPSQPEICLVPKSVLDRLAYAACY